MMRMFFLSLCMFSVNFIGHAQSCLGLWTTIDDETGLKKSVVELYKKDGKMYGKVVYIYKRGKDGPHSLCEQCHGSLKNKPVLGMQIVKNLTWNNSEWTGGTILDPNNGKTYDAKIWINPENHNKLNVRGYFGPVFRTQTWIKTEKIPED
jgi:uncharacterized protein (DUF2147 family)